MKRSVSALLGSILLLSSVSLVNAAPSMSVIPEDSLAPQFIGGDTNAAAAGGTSEDKVWAFLRSQQTKLGLTTSDLKTAFQIKDKQLDAGSGIEHFRLQQVVNGVPVYGADQTIHVDNKTGKVTSFLGAVIPSKSRSSSPRRRSSRSSARPTPSPSRPRKPPRGSAASEPRKRRLPLSCSSTPKTERTIWCTRRK